MIQLALICSLLQLEETETVEEPIQGAVTLTMQYHEPSPEEEREMEELLDEDDRQAGILLEVGGQTKVKDVLSIYPHSLAAEY